MTIKFLGHASFLITSDEGVRIITDPYEPGGYDGFLVGKQNVEKVASFEVTTRADELPEALRIIVLESAN